MRIFQTDINLSNLAVLILFSSFSLFANALTCPDGFIPVPGDLKLGTTDFCVMKFEAKAWWDKNSDKTIDSGEIKVMGCEGIGPNCEDGPYSWAYNRPFVPVSAPEGKPWRHVDLEDSIAGCQKMAKIYSDYPGMEFDLITNLEWQTIARNIEQQKANWSRGEIGSGCVKEGNSGDNSECSYKTAVPGPEAGSNPDAMHVLSNGERIYHFSGNVWEWIKDDNLSVHGWKGKMAFLSEPTFGPARIYNLSEHPFCNETNRFCGFGFGKLIWSFGVLARGGGSNRGGIYEVIRVFKSTGSDSSTGFRCVTRPII